MNLIEAYYKELSNLYATPNEKPFSGCQYNDFEADNDSPAKRQRLSSMR